MAKFRWTDYLPAVGIPKRKSGETLVQIEQMVVYIRILRSVRWAVQVTGIGLAAIAVQHDGSWVCSSPLFKLVGSITMMMLLCGYLCAGTLIKFIYDNGIFLAEAGRLLPFGIEPWRSASGIIAVFIALSYVTRVQKITEDIKPERLGLAAKAAWITAAAVWSAAAYYLITSPSFIN